LPGALPRRQPRVRVTLSGRDQRDRAARIRELKTYALAHLGDPGLSPHSAARASYISVRQLHRLFAHDGLSFAAWLRERRLRRCRDDLADPGLHHLAISAIAARWGYRSQVHFTRAFSARFGVTPRVFRGNGFPAQRLAWPAQPVPCLSMLCLPGA